MLFCCVGVTEGTGSGLDEDTLSQLVEVLSVEDVPWRKLAEKLGMMTLTHLYVDSPTPCHQLLQHYKVTRPLLCEHALAASSCMCLTAASHVSVCPAGWGSGPGAGRRASVSGSDRRSPTAEKR